MKKIVLIFVALLFADAACLSAVPNPKEPEQGTYSAQDFLKGIDATVKLARGLKLNVPESAASMRAVTYVDAFMDGLAAVQLLTGKNMIQKKIKIQAAIVGLQKFIRANNDLRNQTARVALAAYLLREGVVKRGL